MPEVFPDRVAAVHRPGRAPIQVLMFGSGILAGLGLATHDAGLPGAVADGLATLSGRGVDLTVVIEADPTSERARTGLLGLRLKRFDTVIVMLGEHHAVSRTRAGRFAEDMETLAALLAGEGEERAPVFVYDSAPAMLDMTGDRTRRTRVTAAFHAEVGENICVAHGIRFKELAAPIHRAGHGGRFSPVAYRGWADLIVERLHLELAESDAWLSSATAKAHRNRPDPEPLRQQALDSMGLDPRESSEVIDFLVRQAKVVFRAAGAAVNVIDHEHQWQKSTTAEEQRVIPRSDAFCDVTIRSDELTLINDTRRDPRVSDSPLVAGTRFYAGYPIHTWDGYRIGSLCVWDAEPREMRESELARLRDFAGRIEQELWAAALRHQGKQCAELPGTESRQPDARAEAQQAAQSHPAVAG